MAPTALLTIEQYLNTSYRPDVEFTDGTAADPYLSSRANKAATSTIRGVMLEGQLCELHSNLHRVR